jgi:hypothetical protein
LSEIAVIKPVMAGVSSGEFHFADKFPVKLMEFLFESVELKD